MKWVFDAWEKSCPSYCFLRWWSMKGCVGNEIFCFFLSYNVFVFSSVRSSFLKSWTGKRGASSFCLFSSYLEFSVAAYC